MHLDFALRRLASLVERLVIYPENMRANLDRTQGLVHSQKVLLALTQKGMAREAAYSTVQSAAMRTWRGEGHFQDLLKENPEVRERLSDAEFSQAFGEEDSFRHVDTIFARVFGEGLSERPATVRLRCYIRSPGET